MKKKRIAGQRGARPFTAAEAAAEFNKTERWVRAWWAMERAEYEANSISRAQPWAALGMSRATWYRHGKPDPAAQQQQQTDQRESASA